MKQVLLTTVNYLAQEPDVISNTQRLLGDAFLWILILIPGASVAMIGYHSLRKIMSDGESGENAERDKKIKKILVAGVIGTSAMGIVNLVYSYFT